MNQQSNSTLVMLIQYILYAYYNNVVIIEIIFFNLKFEIKITDRIIFIGL